MTSDFAAPDPELLEELLTPALVIYADAVRHNIDRAVSLLNGDPSRWRPHIKTVKLPAVMRMLTSKGVTRLKCATTLELLNACEAGATDVLVAYAHSGRNAQRVAEIARLHPQVRVSCLVEDPAQIAAWQNTPVSLFIDVNTGMNRTGASEYDAAAIKNLAGQIQAAGIEFRGLHYYDGHVSNADMAERTAVAHAGYQRLLGLCDALAAAGLAPREVISAGTPALPCALSFEPFQTRAFHHQVSPGTIVYNDTTSLALLPATYDLRPAVVVVSRVISHPGPQRITCDAGHKAVSVDAGVPNCVALNHPGLNPLKPSEEHLPMDVAPGAEVPPIGSYLWLLPRHVCPTVNNFDYALLYEDGASRHVEPVTARGHEGPFSPAS